MRRNTSDLSRGQGGELNFGIDDREAIVALAQTTQDCLLKWLKPNPDLVI